MKEEGGTFPWDREVKERCNSMWEAHVVLTEGQSREADDGIRFFITVHRVQILTFLSGLHTLQFNLSLY